VVSLGNIEPGEQGTATFQGQIDLEAARTDYYTPCLSVGSPITCEQYLDWGVLNAFVYDASAHPMDWAWADHRVDGDPPEFFDIEQPELFVSAGNNTMRGYAYDQSGVPTLTLGVESPAGTTVCPDPSPDDGRWSCQWDATAANGGTPPSDGDQFNLRLQASDSYGQSSVWTGWRTFIVDTLPPSVTFSAQSRAYSETVLNDTSLTFGGLITDNRSIAGVNVCVNSEGGANECGSANVQALGEVTRIYTDAQSSPIISTTVCVGGRITRTFIVTDSFAVGEVRLGFNADHARRNDISATLTSPTGMSVRVLGPKAGDPPDDQNYDVLLHDAATSGLYEFKGDDDTAAPYFDRETRPADPMRVFRGEDSAGTWTLAICDTAPITHHGVYSHSQLLLTPQDTAARTGNWFYNLSNLDEMDGITHTLQAYAMDLVGNQSEPITLTFEIDNVAPALAVTATVELTATTPNRPSIRVLAGTASDGGRIVQMYAFVRTPAGDLESRQIGRSDAGWWFDLAAGTTGDYAIWVNAVDAAGNVSTVAPSTVTVVQVVAANDGPTALGASTTLTATVMGDSGYDLTWNLGDNTIVSGYQLTTTQHTYPDVGAYTAVVTASKGTDTFTATTTVIVDEAIAGLSAANDSPTFLGNATTLTATLTAGSNVSYTWNLGDGELRRGAVVAHAYPSAGTYTATVTAENSVSVLTRTCNR
jgi:subtilisin-like proprotein convertase family protein